MGVSWSRCRSLTDASSGSSGMLVYYRPLGPTHVIRRMSGGCVLIDLIQCCGKLHLCLTACPDQHACLAVSGWPALDCFQGKITTTLRDRQWDPTLSPAGLPTSLTQSQRESIMPLVAESEAGGPFRRQPPWQSFIDKLDLRYMFPRMH